MAKKPNSGTNESAQIKDLKSKLGKSKVPAAEKKEFFKILSSKDINDEAIQSIEEAIKISEEPDESSDAKSEIASSPKPSKQPAKKTNPTSEPKPSVTPEDEFAELSKTKDFKKFIQIQIAIDALSEDIDIENLSDNEIRKITSDYHGWVNADRPKPQLTKEAKGKIEKILSVTRTKHIGHQYLTYIKEGDEIPTGLEYDLTYAQVPQGDGTFITDTNIVVKREPRYTIKYSDAEAKKLMDRCLKESVVPKFYLALSRGRTVSVHNHENFTGDFDQAMARAMRGEVI